MKWASGTRRWKILCRNFSTHWRTHAENSQEINQRLQNEMNFILCGLMAYGETAFKHELGKLFPRSMNGPFRTYTTSRSSGSPFDFRSAYRVNAKLNGCHSVEHGAHADSTRRALQKKRNETHRMNYGSIAWNLFLFSWKITTSNSNTAPMKKKKKK